VIRAKKSLGQNFLIDKNIIDKIINTVSITNNEILEVGPGTGNLTREILKNNPSKMYLIEKDTFLVESLKEIIDERVKIFNEDILKFDENSLSKKKNYSIRKFTIQCFNRDFKYMDYKFKKRLLVF
jgi:16S rRNA (adenine1518-N6/adenine1519-N6)-dimethyltransferase